MESDNNFNPGELDVSQSISWSAIVENVEGILALPKDDQVIVTAFYLATRKYAMRPEDVLDLYLGCYKSVGEYFQENLLDIPNFITNYVDWESFAKDYLATTGYYTVTTYPGVKGVFIFAS